MSGIFELIRDELMPGLKARIDERRRAMREAKRYELVWHADSMQKDKYGPQACADFARASWEWAARAVRYMSEIADMERELSELEARLVALEQDNQARAEEGDIWADAVR